MTAVLIIMAVLTAAIFLGGDWRQNRLRERDARKGSYSAPSARSAEKPMERLQKSKAVARSFTPDVDGESTVPFANMIRSLNEGQVVNFAHWKADLLKRENGDAAEFVARVFEARGGHASLFYAWAIWYGSGLMPYRHAVPVPGIVLEVLERAFESIEALFSLNSWIPILKVSLPAGIEKLKYPIENAKDLYKNLGSGLADLSELRALDRSYPAHALWSTFDDLYDADRDDGCPLPVKFWRLARTLAFLSAHDGFPVHLKGRCPPLAISCAAQVSPDNLNYGEVAAAFQKAGIRLPGFTPHPTEGCSIRIGFNGSIEVVAGGQVQADASPPFSELQLSRMLGKSLFGLVGLERLRAQLAHDLCEFLSERQSKGRVFWGASGVGKTEVAQRLAGLRDGFPGLSIGSGKIEYRSGVDGKLEVKDIVDALPPLSILFIDEADKCMGPSAGMVSPADATQVRHAILTHFQRKPIYWVFLGVFSQGVSGISLTEESLRGKFGDELAHRLDFADWGFPSWTLANLLRAVNSASSIRKLEYEPEAALVLAQHCIKSGGGVRAFDILETGIVRFMKFSGVAAGTKVSRELASEALARRGARTDDHAA